MRAWLADGVSTRSAQISGIVAALCLATVPRPGYASQAATADPATLQRQLAAAFSNYQAKKYADAQEQLERLAKEYRSSSEVKELLGLVYSAQGKSALAAKAFEQAATLAPSEENLFNWGNELLEQGQMSPAAPIFQRGTRQYPRSARLWVGLGIALYARSDYGGAISALLPAAKINPADPRPYFFLANAYSLGSNVPEAEGDQVREQFRRLQAANPRNPQVLFYYALCLLKPHGRGSPEKLSQVEALLKESARLDPGFPAVHLELGLLYQRAGKDDEAIQEFRQAVRLNPNLAAAHYRLGQLYKQAHEENLAAQELQIFERLHAQAVPELAQQGREIDRFLASLNASGNKH